MVTRLNSTQHNQNILAQYNLNAGQNTKNSSSNFDFANLITQYSSNGNNSASASFLSFLFPQGGDVNNPMMYLMASIVGLITGQSPEVLLNTINQTQQVSATQETSETKDAKSIEATKKQLDSDFTNYKSIGIEISDWDANNSCTLSVNGNTGTITIMADGSTRMANMDAIMEYIKENSPEEKAAVEKQEKFVKSLEDKGNPVVGDAQPVQVSINGEQKKVLEYTTKNGEKYYLDDSGNQVTPDS